MQNEKQTTEIRSETTSTKVDLKAVKDLGQLLILEGKLRTKLLIATKKNKLALLLWREIVTEPTRVFSHRNFIFLFCFVVRWSLQQENSALIGALALILEQSSTRPTFEYPKSQVGHPWR